MSDGLFSTDSTDEVSIRRCQWLLKQRGYRYWRERDIGQFFPLHAKIPDFLVEAVTRFFLEVKSFEQATALDRVDPSIRTFSLDTMSIQKRANRLVRDAAEQLLPYAGYGLPMVIGLDNHRQKGISLDEHTLGGLFGQPQVEISIDPKTGSMLEQQWTRADDNSPLGAGRNSHISAVLAIIPVERFDTLEKPDDFSVERKMRVRIIYNPDATVPFPREVFKEPEDEHVN